MGANYRRLGVSSLEARVGAGVYYGAGVSEAAAMQGQSVAVVGAGNSAGQAAVHLARYASRVTMLVRSGGLARTMSDYLIREIKELRNVEVRSGVRVVDGIGEHRLQALVVEDASGSRQTVPATALFVLIGAEPRTSWLPPSILRDERGFILTSDALARRDADASSRLPLAYETSLPGVFAVGDVRHGSVKRVASAVGEGGVVVSSVHQFLAMAREEGAPAERH